LDAPGRPFFDSDGDNTAQAMKSSGGFVYFLEVSNTNTADAYFQMFDAETSDVTVGTTTPSLSIHVPAGDGTLRGSMDMLLPGGIIFNTAITYSCTTTATGSGDPSTGLVVNAVVG
jgi:hypothetical protein